MAFNSDNFERVAGGQRQLWMYDTADAIATVAASGYFNEADEIVRQNDVIIVIGSTGGTRTVDLLVVSSATAATTVTTINGT